MSLGTDLILEEQLELNDRPPLDIAKYRASEDERERTTDLMRLVPKGLRSVLDVGARDGHFSRLLTQQFACVTALDLAKPPFRFERVTTVAGDITALQFPDASFDCVFCAEVLEHIPKLDAAVAELTRVARHHIVIGVPFRQDLRIGRGRCTSCGKTSPPWGHVNTFDEQRIRDLFPSWKVSEVAFVGSTRDATSAVSAMLMDWAGNPWASQNEDSPCVHCGEVIPEKSRRSLLSRGCSAVAWRLDRLQRLFTKPRGNWIHVALERR